MRILITGAGGFVGTHLRAALAHAYPTAELITPSFDITDAAAVDTLVTSATPDSCIHLAAISAIPDARANPDRAWAVNLHGTLTLARAILRHTPKCRLVYASSSDIYGASFKSGKPLDETAPPAPLNTYGATKAAADLALGAMAAEGLNVLRLRPFNHTGPGQLPNFAVPAFARQLARIEAGLQPPVIEVGDLSAQRDFLDVRDVCTAYAASLHPDRTLPPGAILNIASGHPRRIGDALTTLIARSGINAEIAPQPDLMRPTDIPIAIGNATAAHTALNWTPQIPWETTLDDVLTDWRSRTKER